MSTCTAPSSHLLLLLVLSPHLISTPLHCSILLFAPRVLTLCSYNGYGCAYLSDTATVQSSCLLSPLVSCTARNGWRQQPTWRWPVFPGNRNSIPLADRTLRSTAQHERELIIRTGEMYESTITSVECNLKIASPLDSTRLVCTVHVHNNQLQHRPQIFVPVLTLCTSDCNKNRLGRSAL